MNIPDKDELRAQILALTAQYYQAAFPEREFVPGQSGVPYGGRVFDHNELQFAVDASLDFWLTAGRFHEQFEREFAQFCGVRHALLCNSGSSANLLALSCLTSPTLGEKRLQSGDEVITVASGFPTTVNPILQNGLVPVFCDVHIPTYNIDVTQLEAALSPKTRAVMLAHTLGNPFDLGTISQFCKQHDLYLIEDCCDAVGATFDGKLVGTWGDVASVSFFPAHHMTMGEGGCVLTNKPRLKTLAESFRDWGRDCWCAPGCDNTCGKRFGWQLGDLPAGYDHKYTYSHVGYNLKLTDWQAAIGMAQLPKLPAFIQARKDNYKYLHDALKRWETFFVLPETTPNAEASPFGFALCLQESVPFERREIIDWLEARKISTRLLFGGNLVRQPAYANTPRRIIGELKNSDRVMNDVFWFGVYPGLTTPMLDWMIQSFDEFCARF